MATKKRGTLTGAVQSKAGGYSPNLRELKARIADDAGEREPVKRLNAELPASLHARFKAKAAEEQRKMSDVLRDLIEGYVG